MEQIVSIELLGVIILLFLFGYIAYRLVKKIVAVLVTTAAIGFIFILGCGLLLYRDIQTFRTHPTKNILLVLLAADNKDIATVAV